MIRDKKIVADFLATKGLRAEEFSKKGKAQSKTPDFRVFFEQDFAFFCEVKTLLRDEWLDQLLEGVGPGVMVGGIRIDPTYNRVSNKIHEAVKQFDAVNPNLVHPNVLVLINHDRDSDFDDLRVAYEGDLITEEGHRYPIFRRISEGRIKQEKLRIHLFVWIDVFEDEPNYFFLYNLNSKEYLDPLCSYFGHEPHAIRAGIG